MFFIFLFPITCPNAQSVQVEMFTVILSQSVQEWQVTRSERETEKLAPAVQMVSVKSDTKPGITS